MTRNRNVVHIPLGANGVENWCKEAFRAGAEIGASYRGQPIDLAQAFANWWKTRRTPRRKATP